MVKIGEERVRHATVGLFGTHEQVSIGVEQQALRGHTFFRFGEKRIVGLVGSTMPDGRDRWGFMVWQKDGEGVYRFLCEAYLRSSGLGEEDRFWELSTSVSFDEKRKAHERLSAYPLQRCSPVPEEVPKHTFTVDGGRTEVWLFDGPRTGALLWFVEDGRLTSTFYISEAHGLRCYMANSYADVFLELERAA